MNRKFVLRKLVRESYRLRRWALNNTSELLILFAVVCFVLFKYKNNIENWYFKEDRQKDFYYRYYDYVPPKSLDM
ncbi:MAG: hypothetical protein K2P81_00635 [Bacteriovoracaceae bacterium]|nr:hypothetical protein [Bacteriovoracaceae bacterium]